MSHAIDQILAGDSREKPNVDPLRRNDTLSYVSIQIILRRFVVVREVGFPDDASDERETEYSNYTEIEQPTVDSLNSFQVGFAVQKVAQTKHIPRRFAVVREVSLLDDVSDECESLRITVQSLALSLEVTNLPLRSST